MLLLLFNDQWNIKVHSQSFVALRTSLREKKAAGACNQ